MPEQRGAWAEDMGDRVRVVMRIGGTEHTWTIDEAERRAKELRAAIREAKDSPGMLPGQTTAERSTKGTLRGSVVEEASGGPGGAGSVQSEGPAPAVRGEARPARGADGGEP